MFEVQFWSNRAAILVEGNLVVNSSEKRLAIPSRSSSPSVKVLLPCKLVIRSADWLDLSNSLTS